MARVERARGSARRPGTRRCASIRWCSPRRWITGAEYTVAILQGQALPSIRIETPRSFYDYEAKYLRDDTRYFCPSGLSSQAEQHLAKLALASFEACGAEGWGRADFMMDRDRPAAAARDQHRARHDRSQPGADGGAQPPGIDFDELVWRVLETSLVRTRAIDG